ncbi:MAG: DUF5979 domain-containing protein [Eubacteriales bacterium]|nr:DUF5979 domain-containing protein [Eubacteriales bacterium]
MHENETAKSCDRGAAEIEETETEETDTEANEKERPETGRKGQAMKETGKWHSRILVEVLVMCLLLAGLEGRIRGKTDAGGRTEGANVSEAADTARSSDTEEAVSVWDGGLDINVLQYGGTVYDNFIINILINGEKYDGEAIVNGEKQKVKDGRIKLKGGTAVQIDSLPFGSTYVITEEKEISYDTRVNGKTGREFSGEFDGTRVYQKVIFANRWKSGSLKLRAVCPEGMDREVFHFTVMLDGEKYSGPVELEGKTIQAEDGLIWLKNGETAQITGIPFGTEFEIIREEAGGDMTIVDGLETCIDSGIVSGQNPSHTAVFESISRNR